MSNFGVKKGKNGGAPRQKIDGGDLFDEDHAVASVAGGEPGEEDVAVGREEGKKVKFLELKFQNFKISNFKFQNFKILNFKFQNFKF